MILSILILFVALTISGVAAWYSIVGLVTIFSAATIPIIVMGTVLEIGKVSAVAWLHINWKKSGWLIRVYLIPAVLVLMLITSMGIFGFLSKAHINQSGDKINVRAKIERIEQSIRTEEVVIARANDGLGMLDDSISKYFELGAVSKGLAARSEQMEERTSLNELIKNSQSKIDKLLDEKFELEQQRRDIELETGPVRYIAQLLYGKDSNDVLEQAVRWVIIMLVFVFDPLAIVLLIAAQQTIQNPKSKKSYYNNRKKNKLEKITNKIIASMHRGENADVVNKKKIVDNISNNIVNFSNEENV